MAGTRKRTKSHHAVLRPREIEVLAVRTEGQMRQHQRLAWNDLRFPVGGDLFHPQAVLIAIVLDIGDVPAVAGNGAIRGLATFRDLGDAGLVKSRGTPALSVAIQLEPNTIAKSARRRTRRGLSMNRRPLHGDGGGGAAAPSATSAMRQSRLRSPSRVP